jgi:hypothetical protein
MPSGSLQKVYDSPYQKEREKLIKTSKYLFDVFGNKNGKGKRRPRSYSI